MTLQQIEDGKTKIIFTHSNPADQAYMQAIIQQLNPGAEVIFIPVPQPRMAQTRPLPDKFDDHEKLDRLSPRQDAVLKLIVKGHSNKEIARKLDISISTVRVHVAAIFRVLEVNSRTAAAALAAGIIARQLGKGCVLHPVCVCVCVCV